MPYFITLDVSRYIENKKNESYKKPPFQAVIFTSINCTFDVAKCSARICVGNHKLSIVHCIFGTMEYIAEIRLILIVNS